MCRWPGDKPAQQKRREEKNSPFPVSMGLLCCILAVLLSSAGALQFSEALALAGMGNTTYTVVVLPDCTDLALAVGRSFSQRTVVAVVKQYRPNRFQLMTFKTLEFDPALLRAPLSLSVSAAHLGRIPILVSAHTFCEFYPVLMRLECEP